MIHAPIPEDIRDLCISYNKWNHRFATMQFIPVVGMIGSVGVLALDAKTYVINNFFTQNIPAGEDMMLRDLLAEETYTRPSETQRMSSFSLRVIAVLNLLTGGCLVPIMVAALILANCFKKCVANSH